jgi:hypothetical protein
MNGKKIIALLESNVQWLAIALGVAYLGWMTWTYVVNMPISLTLGQEILSPGEVDPYIDQHVAQPLSITMKEPGHPELKPTPLPEVAPDILTDQYVFADDIFRGTPQSAAPVNPTPAPSNPGLVPVVTQLPTLPQVTIVDSQGGRSSIVPGSEAGQAAPAPAAGGAAAATQPPQDCIWAAVKFSIPAKDLEAAFNAVNIPTAVRKTTFLRVVLMRQEELAGNDNWGPEQQIGVLSNIAAKVPNLPAEGDTSAQASYLAMAEAPQNVTYILQPPFYQVKKGDIPFVVVPPPPFDPTKDYTDEEKALMTPEQRQAVADYQAKKAAEARKARQAQQPQRPAPAPQRGGPPNGYPSGPPRNNLVTDPQRDAREGSGVFFAPVPPPPPAVNNSEDSSVGSPREAPDRDHAPPQSGQVPSEQPAPGQQPGQSSATPTLPGGDFFPSQMVGDIVGWAYDETVVPGRIYRYRVVYMVKNPIYGSANIAKDPALAQRFILSSDESASQSKYVWTPKVSVPSLTTIFMASNVLSGADHSVRIRVFKWQAGEVKIKLYEDVMPGDQIGHKESDGDFETGFTLVDAESQSDTPDSGAYMLLMDDHGNLVRHEYRTDRTQQALQAAAMSAAVTSQSKVSTQ